MMNYRIIDAYIKARMSWKQYSPGPPPCWYVLDQMPAPVYVKDARAVEIFKLSLREELR